MDTGGLGIERRPQFTLVAARCEMLRGRGEGASSQGVDTIMASRMQFALAVVAAAALAGPNAAGAQCTTCGGQPTRIIEGKTTYSSSTTTRPTRNIVTVRDEHRSNAAGGVKKVVHARRAVPVARGHATKRAHHVHSHGKHH